MLAALTGLGLSAAAGLNAYIPFLIVAVLARFTDVLTLPAGFVWIESTWAISVAAVLLVTEVVLDKIAVIDHINDAVGTFIRPTIGGLIFAATSAAEDLERGSTFLTDHPWVGAIGGAVLAGIVHTAKAVSRPVVNVSTVGLGTPVVSSAEDGASVGLSLAAIFLPILVLLLLALLAAGFIWLWRYARRRRRRRSGSRDRPDPWRSAAR